MSTISLNGITNLGNAHALSLQLINATGTGWDDVKTLISAGGGSGTVTSATSPLTITSGVLSVDLSSKQPLITSSTDLALQDATLRNITASASAFTLKGGAISYIRDSANNLIMDIQNSRVEFLKPVNMQATANFYQAISLTNTASSLSGQMYVTTGNKMQWNGQEVPDLPTILGLLASKITNGSGLSRTANNTTGAVALSLDQTFQHSQMKFTGSTKTLRNVTNNSVDELTWGTDVLATVAQVPINIVQTNQTATTANTSFSNSSITIASHTRGIHRLR